MIVLLVIYFFCIALIVYSYVVYPALLSVLSTGKQFSHQQFTKQESLPDVVIFFAVYNGEKVLREKLQSMLQSDYPSKQIKILVGSDESSDSTDSIVKEFSEVDSRVELHRFARRGKANVLNSLRDILQKRSLKNDTIFILTDAYAIFEPQTVFELVRHFKDDEIGIVGAKYINTNVQEGGISIQEKAYIQRENMMKYRESLVFGSMMGVYGACYAIRATDYPPFPTNILMEDFYVTMLMLQNNKKSILTLDAKFYESIPNSMDIEYSRKRRIAAGNFQNLFHFPALLSPLHFNVAFPYWSHKVIRWFGPLLIFTSYVCIFFVAFSTTSFWAIGLLGIHLFLVFIPAIDFLLKKVGIEIAILRYANYFLQMNMAVVSGFVWFAKGIKTNVWQPTAR